LAILHPFGVVDVGDLPEKFQTEEAISAAKNSSEVVPAPMPESMVLKPTSVEYQEPRLPRGGIDLKEHLSSLEQSFIKQALDDAGGVVAHAAKRLGMRRTTLVEKLRKYGLQRAEAS